MDENWENTKAAIRLIYTLEKAAAELLHEIKDISGIHPWIRNAKYGLIAGMSPYYAFNGHACFPQLNVSFRALDAIQGQITSLKKQLRDTRATRLERKIQLAVDAVSMPYRTKFKRYKVRLNTDTSNADHFISRAVVLHKIPILIERGKRMFVVSHATKIVRRDEGVQAFEIDITAITGKNSSKAYYLRDDGRTVCGFGRTYKSALKELRVNAREFAFKQLTKDEAA